MSLKSDPFLCGKDGCGFLKFPGVARGVREWEAANGESGGRVKGDTDGSAGLCTHRGDLHR
jgi:hypothetical protein